MKLTETPPEPLNEEERQGIIQESEKHLSEEEKQRIGRTKKMFEQGGADFELKD